MRKIAENCYLPANQIMLDLIKEHGGKFKISYSISGSALEQFQMYAPEVLSSFKKLAETGCVEFLAETYSHSLSSLKSKEEFTKQVKLHTKKIKELFGQVPKIFRNTELVYSDLIGENVADMGYKAMLTEGAKHILGWKSPNYLYFNANNHKLKLLLKNYKLSDDIAFRFSNKSWDEWPLTAEKYVDWLNAIDSKEEVVNLFLDYETFGEHQWAETGIFDFLRMFPKTVFEKSEFAFLTPSEVASKHQPIAPMNVPYPISWADEERDLSAWIGNELQNEAFDKLYNLEKQIYKIKDPEIHKDWNRLQNSDHFYYMCTKFFADGDVHKYFNPYNNPYDAFINYMNVISDFTDRLKKASKEEFDVPEDAKPEEIEKLVSKYETTLKKLRVKLKKLKSPIVAGKKEKIAIAGTKKVAKALTSKTIKIDGRMTVATIKEMFKDSFKVSLRIYKGNTAGRGGKKADEKQRLAKIADERRSLASIKPFVINENMTIKEFEIQFQKTFDIAVQIADSSNRKLLDNKLKLMAIKKKK
jgi:alpha-amylase